MDTGHWTTVLDLEEGKLPYGFIYKITCNCNSKSYIGKKQCKTIFKRKPLKGKKNKRHEERETDWKIYTSSSRELNEDIILHGKNNFKFEIIRLCESKFELAYFEAKIQFEEEVLLRDDYYNGIINIRLGKPKNGNAYRSIHPPV
jgi:hypothetical protein